jgi:hypothetical protein
MVNSWCTLNFNSPEHGVPTPLNDAVREIEDGTREMSLNNVNDSVFTGI